MPDMKEAVLNEIFKIAVFYGNKKLVEILLDKSRLRISTLSDAVHSSNLDIVNMILSLNSDPSFINMVDKMGSALNIAVSKNNAEIVKRLLSLPGINTTCYDSNDCTPLMTDITNFNIEIIDIFVEFYGDQISSQIWQISNSILKILSVLSKNEKESKEPTVPMNNDDDEDNDDTYDEGNMLKTNLFDIKQKSLNKEKKFKTISKLAEIENVDLNLHFSKHTLLSYACEANEIDLFISLLKSNKVDVNVYSPLTGNSPLMIAIQNNNIQIANLLIENSQTDINH